MKYGFIQAAAVSPSLRVADCAYNAQQIIACAAKAAEEGAQLVCLPELSLTGYTCGDLFLQRTLQEGAEAALRTVMEGTASLNAVILAGLPVAVNGKLYNCAAVVCGGRLLGLVPKTCLPNYGEFYELRHFTPAPDDLTAINFAGQKAVPFGTRLLFCCAQMPEFVLGVEICEDLWAPVTPSSSHALAGATVLCNLSASDETAGKAEYRRSLVTGQSARLLCCYLYADAGHGESTTDTVFAAHDLIAENGVLMAESPPFGSGVATARLDLGKIVADRLRNTTFSANRGGYQYVSFDLRPVQIPLDGAVDRSPFIPFDRESRTRRCELILSIQADGLARRIEHAHCRTAVIGISGGLDSSLALLVSVRAMKQLGRPVSDIIAVTMPCFGTTRRTRSNAEILCTELGVNFSEINITETVRRHLADIGHSETDYDVTFENAQARVRTLTLMDVANQTNGLVVGTGDLSELALGWATYNGDHMSMYGVNAGIPKTLVRYLVLHEAYKTTSPALQHSLLDILDTPVSPELLPAQDGKISQKTEDLVGPYQLHDFYLFYALRFGFGPAKIYHLAKAAFHGEYDEAVLLKWLKNFYRRFFTQQFKRSCLPDGPKVGSVTLSPRGDWRMPSDAVAALWLDELEALE